MKPDFAKIGLLVLALGMFPAGVAVDRYVLPVIAAPVIPSPTPAPTPTVPAVPLKLSTGELYVADASYDSFLLASPPELVTITRKEAPITIHSKIVPGTGKLETRKFAGPAVFTVEAAGTGRCELLLIRVGAQGPADVVHRVLDVDSGSGPRPPPEPPIPTPTPTPEPPLPPKPVDPFQATLAAAYAQETDAQKASQTAILAACYRQGASTVMSLTVPTDPLGKRIARVGDFWGVFKASVNKSLPASALPRVRLVLGAESSKTLPTNEAAPLDDKTRALISSTFTRLATDLEALR